MRIPLLVSLVACALLAAPARADRFGDIDFRVPAGWQKVEKGGFAILASPPDARGKPHAAVFVAPGSTYDGDFPRWFADTVREGESGERSIARGAPQRIASKGAYDALTIDSVTRDRLGTATHRTYIAANPGGRAELFVYLTYGERDQQQYLPALREFLGSVRYAQGGGRDAGGTAVARTGPPRPAPPRTGGHCRVVTRQQCTSGMSGGFGGTMAPTYNCLPVSKTVCD